MSQYEGFVFPLSRKMLERAISEELKIFTKYTPLDINPGNIIYFYDTGKSGSRQIIAKAKVNSTQRIPAENVWNEYGNQIIPNKTEFEEYISGRESKEVEVVNLSNINYLDEPVDPPGNITIAGLTLDEERHQEILDQI